MNLDECHEEIHKLMLRLVNEVESKKAMRTYISHICETVILPILSEVYEYKALRNLNTEERHNFPAIDLGDESASVAFQVTTDSSSNKIKKTLQKFSHHKLYEHYRRLQFYILTIKKPSYAGSDFAGTIQKRFKFDHRRDILDYRNILSAVSGFDLNKSEKIRRILDYNLNDLPNPYDSIRQSVSSLRDIDMTGSRGGNPIRFRGHINFLPESESDRQEYWLQAGSLETLLESMKGILAGLQKSLPSEEGRPDSGG